MVHASGANILPSIPWRVMSGRNTSTMMPTPKSTGLPTSAAARSTTTLRLSPESLDSPKWANAFSTTTTEPSTMMPMAMASPPRDMRLAEMPN